MSLLAVHGMHRSGTSLVAAMLHRLGWDVGDPDDLMAPKPDNPLGFVEHLPAVRINDSLLHRLGGTWRRPPGLPSGWAQDPALDDLREEATAVVAGLTGRGHERVLFKDPRLSLTLPFWQTVTSIDAGVLVLRAPLPVIRSLLKRHDDMSAAEAADLYVTYTLHALSHDLPVVLVDPEALLADPRGELLRLTAELGHAPEADALDAAVAAFAPELWGRSGRTEDGPAPDDDRVAAAVGIHGLLTEESELPWPRILGRLRTADSLDRAVARSIDERTRLAKEATTYREGRLRAIGDRDTARAHARSLQEKLEAERVRRRDHHDEMQTQLDELAASSRSTIAALRLQLEELREERSHR